MPRFSHVFDEIDLLGDGTLFCEAEVEVEFWTATPDGITFGSVTVLELLNVVDEFGSPAAAPATAREVARIDAQRRVDDPSQYLIGIAANVAEGLPRRSGESWVDAAAAWR